MHNYQKLNNIIGWAVFVIASIVYVSTIEPTASFWDCGEYIACSYKLEVGHPPGAPLFILLGRFFTLFAFGDVSKAAMWVNVMSALCSALAILFLFWTITALAKKIMLSAGELTAGKTYAVMGSGIIGALAYTFSDSFWFSAVEGEVYAMSQFFTAVVFWAIFKWDADEDEVHRDRWLVLIAFLVGLSIGVHLLNLLTIPTLVYIYYFKKHKVTRNGFIIAGVLSVLILGLVQSVIIPGIVKLAASFELFFVNTVGMPFNFGTVIYFALLVGAIVYGLQYTTKRGKHALNTILLCFTVLIIGYSSFFVLIIRSKANTPIDENNPENAVTLLSYLKREQYGDWPILYGQYYNSPYDAQDPYLDGEPVYMPDEKLGKYVIADDRTGETPNYDQRFCTYFPRMWSQQDNHERAYKVWADIKGMRMSYDSPFTGKREEIYKPKFFSENLVFFLKYQVVHMYWRYFMWNFVGRQNDIQGNGIEYTSRIEGNWISGIKPIDALFLGKQDKLPESVTQSKVNNKFYFLPFILGLIGLVFHFKKNKKDAFVVLLLFLLTGLAIVIYLNQYPYQPRERDYAYAGSFYAFAIWIGLGTLALFEMLKARVRETSKAVAVAALCLVVPAIMAQQGWDDHNRSNRYTARDYAANYLNSCAPNAILFTNGDNDTFPLWYAQEVEGIRTDVRVVNLSLSNTDWYIEQIRKRAYKSAPLPLSLSQDKYIQGKRDFIPIAERPDLKNQFTDLKSIVDFVGSESPKAKRPWGDKMRNYLPTKNFRLEFDSAKFLVSEKDSDTNMGTTMILPKDKKDITSAIEWTIDKTYIMKNDLLVMDILASNNWERPVYFAVTTGPDAYLNLEPHFQLEGLAYRLVPLNGKQGNHRVATDIMYNNIMNKFRWGGVDIKEVYMDENNLRMAATMRMQMITLAGSLMQEEKKDKAIKVLDKCMEVLPERNVPFFNEPLDYTFYMIQTYYDAGAIKQPNEIAKRFLQIVAGNMEYYLSLKGKERNGWQREIDRKVSMLNALVDVARKYKQDAIAKDAEAVYQKYESYVSAPTQP